MESWSNIWCCPQETNAAKLIIAWEDIGYGSDLATDSLLCETDAGVVVAVNLAEHQPT